MHPSLFFGHTVKEQKNLIQPILFGPFFGNLVLFPVVFLAQKWRFAISVDGGVRKMGRWVYFRKWADG